MQQFADGGIETYSYFLTGGIITQTTVTDALGRQRTERFNAAGYPIEHRDELGQQSRFDHNLEMV